MNKKYYYKEVLFPPVIRFDSDTRRDWFDWFLKPMDGIYYANGLMFNIDHTRPSHIYVFLGEKTL